VSQRVDIQKLSSGVPGLDEVLGGGIPELSFNLIAGGPGTGKTTLAQQIMFACASPERPALFITIVGPSGSGKTTLSTQFIREGIEHGEPGLIAVFEKRPDEYLTTATQSEKLSQLVDTRMLKMLYLRPLDLSVDETMEEIGLAVRAIGAKRVAIDSLSGFELALAPSFRDDFRESLYRMVGALVRLGVTVVMTAELVESYTELRLSPHGISFLTDGIILQLQRYIELDGALRKLVCVVKMRGFDHAKQMKLYDIGPDGIVMGEVLTGYRGLLTGSPRRTSGSRRA
jgi:circadian clock protein KaiC